MSLRKFIWALSIIYIMTVINAVVLLVGLYSDNGNCIIITDEIIMINVLSGLVASVYPIYCGLYHT